MFGGVLVEILTKGPPFRVGERESLRDKSDVIPFRRANPGKSTFEVRKRPMSRQYGDAAAAATCILKSQLEVRVPPTPPVFSGDLTNGQVGGEVVWRVADECDLGKGLRVLMHRCLSACPTSRPSMSDVLRDLSALSSAVPSFFSS
jgi:hypothetical protein